MSRVEKSALVPYSASMMYELVADVEGYSGFLPWCSDSKLLSRDENQICGEIEVSRSGIRQRFVTCNDLEKDRRIGLHLKKGPFRRLEGAWRFTPLQKHACKVELVLEFEFSGALIDKAFGRVFNQIAVSLVDAFCKRAGELYG